MKTDKNTLFRAIGEIDEKFVSEILEEDASNASVIKSFDAAKAATSAKKKASGAKKFMMYYLPAVAGLLICAVIVKSFMTSKDSAAGSANAECATAPMATAETTDDACYEAVAEMDSVSNAEILEDADYDDMASATSADKPDNGATFGMEDEESIFIDGMPNPFADCETLEEACEIAGVDLVIPDDFGFGFTRIYRAMKGRMIEVIFMDGDNEVYRIRKGLVSELGEDISGDYNEYDYSSEVKTAGCNVEMFGNSEDEMMMARWNDGTYAYSITCEDPIPEVSMVGIINMMMEQ